MSTVREGRQAGCGAESQEAVISGVVRFHPALEPLLVPIGQVRPHPDNPSSGDEEAIAVSIQVSGMYRPVYAQTSTGYILAGNTTYAACLDLGATVIPVIWLDVDEEAALRILLGDNQLARLALVDQALLEPQLERLLQTELALLGTGYEPLTQVRDEVAELPEPDVGHTITVWLSGDQLASFFEVPGDTDRERLFRLLIGWIERDRET
jgi:ParB-like chromosome segregation protein Spo0J